MKRGFTLLELMVVIGIIGIMTGIGLVSLVPAKKNIALKTAQDEVTSAIKLAQSYALQGKSISGVSDICGYGFRFIDPPIAGDPIVDYEIFYYKAGADCTGGKTESTVESQDLKNGVSLTSPVVANTKIYFGIPSADISGTGVPQTFTFSSGSDSKIITISSSGLVTEN